MSSQSLDTTRSQRPLEAQHVAFKVESCHFKIYSFENATTYVDRDIRFWFTLNAWKHKSLVIVRVATELLEFALDVFRPNLKSPHF